MNQEKSTIRSLLTRVKELEQQLNEQGRAIDNLQDINEEYATVNEELKEKNKLLHESEEKFHALFDQSFDLIFLHDMQGRIVDINKRVIQYYGYTKKEFIQLGIPGLDPEYAKREAGGAFWEKLDFQQPIRFEAQHIKKNTEIIDVEIFLSKIRVKGRIFIMAVCRDITERKESEKRLLEFQHKLETANEKLIRQNQEQKTLNKELKKSLLQIQQMHAHLKEAKIKAEESDRLKSVFLSNLSHEVRTPMNGIMGFTELLTITGLEKSESSHYIQLIQLCSKQLLRMIDDLLDISRLESGEMQLEYEETDLHSILMDLYKTYLDDPTIDQHQKKLIFQQIPHPGDLVFSCDKNRLKQILDCLITNAIKFTREGEITVNYYLNGNQINFAVRDTGIGIAKEDHLKIFKMFRQVQEENNRFYGGSGLGLALVKSLVIMMDGDVWLKSQPGKGSTFHISIPFHPRQKEMQGNQSTIRESDEETTAWNQNWSDKTVLLVEDNPDSMELLETILQPTNIRILKATDGQEALEIYQTSQPDLILLDIQIPSINGIEVVKKIRENDHQTRIIAQSAYTLKPDIQKAHAAGCNDYLTKPIIIKDILQVLSKYLN